MNVPLILTNEDIDWKSNKFSSEIQTQLNHSSLGNWLLISEIIQAWTRFLLSCEHIRYWHCSGNFRVMETILMLSWLENPVVQYWSLVEASLFWWGMSKDCCERIHWRIEHNWFWRRRLLMVYFRTLMTKNLSNLYLINGRLLSTANCSSCESLIFLSPNAINQSTVDFSFTLYEFIKPNQQRK